MKFTFVAAVLAICAIGMQLSICGCQKSAPTEQMRVLKPVRIEGGAGETLVDHWKSRGFAEMVPPIQLPTDNEARSHTRVWLKVPKDARIDVTPHAATGEPTLVMPPGTVADRVETYEVGPHRWEVVADVRGGEMLPGGGQSFHVLRPLHPVARDSDSPHALAGWAWDKSDAIAEKLAHQRWAEAMRAGSGFIGRPKGERLQKAIEGFVQRGQCAVCHVPHLTAATEIDDVRSVLRPTDANGWFAAESVLRNEAPVERYRPRDRNADDRHVTVTCRQGGARLDSQKSGARRWHCTQNEVPTGRFDIVAALAAGDERAGAVCESRRYLFEHMTAEARAAFEQRFAECEIGSGAPPVPTAPVQWR